MLTEAQVRRYSAQSGLRDLMIAEKEVVLTFLLQLLSERGILNRLAFKGGTCLRKMFIGSQGRFSTDLDFTGLEDHDHEDVILAMMGAFEQEFHGIKFHIPDNSYYETVDGLSWGVNPTYAHEWNGSGESEIKLQISRRETPTVKPSERLNASRATLNSCPSRQWKSTAWLCPRYSQKKSAPAISATSRGTFTIWECMRRGRSTMTAFVG
jgi:hypothetical protein